MDDIDSNLLHSQHFSNNPMCGEIRTCNRKVESMEFFSLEFLSALMAIVLIDLVLAGDNALIIGLVARSLPPQDQRRVIFWGTFGAIAIRAIMAMFVVYLLAVPGFLLVGGLALLWIARKLAQPPSSNSEVSQLHAPAHGVLAAIKTVIIADAVMGIDNVIAIGGAAHGSLLLLVLGLAISVPIIVWGSHLVIKLVDRYPVVILLGSAVLVHTGMGMLLRESMVANLLAGMPAVILTLYVLAFTVCLSPFARNHLSGEMGKIPAVACVLLVWLLIFEVFEYKWGLDVNYLDADTWAEAGLNLLRMLGWIPLAVAWLWAHARLEHAWYRR